MSDETDWHDYRIGKDELPPVCCDCLKDMSKLSEAKLAPLTYPLSVAGEDLAVLRCQSCTSSARGKCLWIWVGSLLAAYVIGAIVLLAFGFDAISYTFVLGAYSPIAFGIAFVVLSFIVAPIAVKSASPDLLQIRSLHPKYRPVRSSELEKLVDLPCRVQAEEVAEDEDDEEFPAAPRRKSRKRGRPIETDLKIVGLRDVTDTELRDEVENGAVFVTYEYAVSIVVLSFRQPSSIHFVRADESRALAGLQYTLISLVAGWWGIPWGPIFTLMAVIGNLRGGTDVTRETLRYLED